MSSNDGNTNDGGTQRVLITREAMNLLEQTLTLDFFLDNDNANNANTDANNDANANANPDNDANANANATNMTAEQERVGTTMNFFALFAETLTELQNQACRDALLDAIEEIDGELLVHLRFLQRLLDEHPRGKKRPYPRGDEDDESDSEADQGAAMAST